MREDASQSALWIERGLKDAELMQNKNDGVVDRQDVQIRYN
jgi:hypothetical protein